MSSKGQVTIPLDVRNALRLREGDKLRFVVHEDGVASLELEMAESPFDIWAGALREDEGRTVEEIVSELQEERGW